MPLTPADVHNVAFSKPPIGKRGYNEDEVDAFLDRIVATLRGTTQYPVTAKDVREVQFSTVMFKPGYLIADVDAFLESIAEVLEQRG